MKPEPHNARKLELLPESNRVLCVGALSLVLVGVASTASAQDACLNDLAGFNNAVCTANDVRISRIDVLDGPTECNEGETITIDSLQAQLLSGAKSRFDIGIYLATDGSDAKTSLSGANDGCRRNILEPGDGASEDIDGDYCQDIAQGVTALKDLNNFTLECRDSDEDGFLDVGTCLSWDNNTKEVCEGTDDVIPGTPSKCRCEPIRVGDIVVRPKGSIIVEKQVVGDSSDQLFSFTGDAAGEIADNGEITVNGLEPGIYTSTEALDEFFSLQSISCDDEDSFGDVGTATATFIVAENETVRCVFTNATTR